jgi:hypothetical protein
MKHSTERRTVRCRHKFVRCKRTATPSLPLAAQKIVVMPALTKLTCCDGVTTPTPVVVSI